MTETLVVDSSVAVKWYVPEPGSDRAARLLDEGGRLLAPDLLVSEVGNVLWKRRRELPAHEIKAIAVALSRQCPVTLVASTTLHFASMSLALRFDRTVYDSLYLALAIAHDCRYVTADERFVNSLRETDVAEFVQIL